MLVPRIVGLAGNAQSGKDSLFECLTKFFYSLGCPIRRIALGDVVKKDLDHLCRERFGISAFTSDINEKTLIRSLMVEYARIQRILSNGTYFTKSVNNTVNTLIDNGGIPIITDIRHGYFLEDELQWLREKQGILIFIDRILPNGDPVSPPNEDEEFHNAYLRPAADLSITWPTFPSVEDRYNYVLPILKKFFHVN
jgi:hypothetical protein